MSLPNLDFETYCEAGYFLDPATGRWKGITKTSPGLPAVGAPAYAEHPSTRVLSLAWDLADGLGPRLWVPGMPAPQELFDYLAGGGLLEAWNSAFEYHIWREVCHLRMGWPPLPYTQLRCAMSKARAHSLPGKLGKAAEAIGATEQKDKAGETLLRKLSVPTNVKTRPTTEDYNALYQYNMQDLRAEEAVSSRCPDLSPFEMDVWLLDQGINFRGVYVDRAALSDCAEIVRQATDRYTGELRRLTGGAVQSVGELAKMTAWLATQGVETRSLESDAVETLLAGELPERARRVLEIRSSLGAASVKKLSAIERRLSRDGRLRDLFAYCGADRTGRWAGRGPQPQNLPGGMASDEVERTLSVIASRDLSTVEAAHPTGDSIAAVSGCLRGLFCAAPGHDLICSDFSAIEAVVLAELAGETWRQDVFRTHGKIYETSASKLTGKTLEYYLEYKKENDKHHPHRKLGKVAELASGYGGGLGAWKAFGADEFMDDDQIRESVKAWRDASPMVVALWWGLQDAALMAITNPGYCYAYRGISYGVSDDILYCQLPSGRRLTYHQPRIHQKMMPWGKETTCITYYGWNSNYLNGPVGWMRLETYGPKLTENLVQAVSRDILAHSMLALDRAGYPIVLHVHDEVVSEVPHGCGSVEEFEQIMGRMPAWATGWPVKAAGGWRGLRYRKD